VRGRELALTASERLKTIAHPEKKRFDETGATMRMIPLPSGEEIPVLGQGTWGMAEDPNRRANEIAALRTGLDLEMTLIDTAEMYADGGAEELVAEAIAGRRNDAFLVSKVLPDHATQRGTIAACEHSLRRLKTDRIDLYLLHWRSRVPLAETLEAFDKLMRTGKIRHWGVSNFDVADMEELVTVTGGDAGATDQVLYNLTRRGIEYDLLPWCEQHNLPVTAYSPIEQGRLLNHPALHSIATRHGVTAARVALAWVLRRDNLNAIPRAGTPAHVRENRAALTLVLTEEDVAALDHAFPPPTGPRPLEML
jgi:diketogulonate reductase-like aldo/keto reductase